MKNGRIPGDPNQQWINIGHLGPWPRELKKLNEYKVKELKNGLFITDQWCIILNHGIPIWKMKMNLIKDNISTRCHPKHLHNLVTTIIQELTFKKSIGKIVWRNSNRFCLVSRLLMRDLMIHESESSILDFHHCNLYVLGRSVIRNIKGIPHSYHLRNNLIIAYLIVEDFLSFTVSYLKNKSKT